MIPSDRFYLSLRSRRSESGLGEGGFFVALLVVAAVAQVVPFLRLSVWQLAAAGRVRLDNGGFAASCVLEDCDAPNAALPFAPAYGFRVDVADVVCDL